MNHGREEVSKHTGGTDIGKRRFDGICEARKKWNAMVWRLNIGQMKVQIKHVKERV